MKGHDAIYALIATIQERSQYGFPTYCCFVDFATAYPSFNSPDHQQHYRSLYHSTSLIHVEDRTIPHDTHHSTLFNIDLSIDNTTIPSLLYTTNMSLPTPTQPLSTTLQHAANKPTIHATTQSYPHTSTQPTTLTPWFLLLTILLLNFTFFSHPITFNSQTTTYLFQFQHELSQSSPALTTPLGPHHDKLLLSNSMTSTHKYRA